jgi:hypothetical protein
MKSTTVFRNHRKTVRDLAPPRVKWLRAKRFDFWIHNKAVNERCPKDFDPSRPGQKDQLKYSWKEKKSRLPFNNPA